MSLQVEQLEARQLFSANGFREGVPAPAPPLGGSAMMEQRPWAPAPSDSQRPPLEQPPPVNQANGARPEMGPPPSPPPPPPPANFGSPPAGAPERAEQNPVVRAEASARNSGFSSAPPPEVRVRPADGAGGAAVGTSAAAASVAASAVRSASSGTRVLVSETEEPIRLLSGPGGLAAPTAARLDRALNPPAESAAAPVREGVAWILSRADYLANAGANFAKGALIAWDMREEGTAPPISSSDREAPPAAPEQGRADVDEYSLPLPPRLMVGRLPAVAASLEHGLRDFLTQMQQQRERWIPGATGATLSPWLMAGAATLAACEIARRQLRQRVAALLLPGSARPPWRGGHS
jgi:hypothetical protein